MRSEDFVATPKRLLNLGKRDARYTYTCIVPYCHYLLILDYTYPMLLVYVLRTYLIAFSLCSIECEIKPSLDCHDPADAF